MTNIRHARGMMLVDGTRSVPNDADRVLPRSTSRSARTPRLLCGLSMPLRLQLVVIFVALGFHPGVWAGNDTVALPCVVSNVTELLTCEAGYFVSVRIGHEPTCAPCPAGTFLPLGGLAGAECQPCPKAHHSFGGARACETCPTDGVRCDGTLTLLPGFWHDAVEAKRVGFTDELQFLPCISDDACSVNTTVAPANNTEPLVRCGDGYEGVRCAVCKPGFGAAGQQCLPCGDSAVSWVLLTVFTLTVFVGAVLAVVRVLRIKGGTKGAQSDHNQVLATLKILFNFMQMTSFLGDFNLDWPSTIRGLFSIASVAVGFGINTSFVDCALHWTLYQRFLVFFTLPFVVVILPGVVLWSFVAWQNRNHRLQRLVDKKLPEQPPPVLILQTTPRSLYTTLVMLYFFLLYPTTTSEAFKVLSCTGPIVGTRYLASDYSLSCDTPQHRTYSVLAWITLSIVSIGFPVLSFALLFRVRKRLHILKVRRKFVFMYSGYSKGRYYWETVIMFRKFAMVAVSSFLGGNQFGHQIYCGIWVVLISMLLHIHFQPFLSVQQGRLEYLCLVVSLLSLLLGQLFALGGVSRGGRSLVIFLVTSINISTIVFLLYHVLKQLGRSFSKTRVGGAAIQKVDDTMKVLHVQEKIDIAKRRSKRVSAAAQMKVTRISRKLSTTAVPLAVRSSKRASANSAQSGEISGMELAKLDQTGRSRMNPMFRGKALAESTRREREDRRGQVESKLKKLQRSPSGRAINTKSRRRSVAPGRVRSASIMMVATPPGLGDPQYSSPDYAGDGEGVYDAETEGYSQEAPSGEYEYEYEDDAADAAAEEDTDTSGWEVRKHPSNGMVYYFNTVTHEQQWEAPEGFEMEEEALPDGWETRVHPTAKITYFYHVATGRQQWERPENEN